MSATRKIAYNTVVQIAGKVIVTIMAAASVAILTRYLGPDGYGKFTIALVFLSFFSIMADLGLFTIVVREISKDKSRTEEIVGNAMSLRLLLTVAVMLLAIGIGWLFPYTTDIKIGIAIASLSLLFGLLNSSLITVLQARLRMDYSVIADIIGRAVSLAAVIVVAWLNLGYFAVVGTAAVGALATFLTSNYFVRRMIKVRFLGDRALWKKLFMESLPLGIVITLTFIYFRLDTILLSVFRSNAEVGLYGAAYKIIELLLTVPGFFVNSVFPVLNAYLAANDTRIRTLINQSFQSLVLLSFPITVALILLGEQLIDLVAGAGFQGSALALQLLAPALIFYFADLLLGYMIVAKGRQKVMIVISGGILVLNVILNVLTIPLFGYVAAAINTVVSEILVFITELAIIRHYYGFIPSFRSLPRVVLATAIMGGAIWLSMPFGLIAATVAGMGTYAAAVYLGNGPGREILALVKAKE